MATGLGSTLLVTVGVGEGAGAIGLVGKIMGVGLGEGLATVTFEPFFQMIFLPDFTHVYLNPLLIEVAPTLGHADPACTMAAA